MSAHGIAAPRRASAPRRPSSVQPRSSQRAQPRAREVGLGQVAVDEAHRAQLGVLEVGLAQDAAARRRPARSSWRRTTRGRCGSRAATTSRSAPSVHSRPGHAAAARGRRAASSRRARRRWPGCTLSSSTSAKARLISRAPPRSTRASADLAEAQPGRRELGQRGVGDAHLRPRVAVLDRLPRRGSPPASSSASRGRSGAIARAGPRHRREYSKPPARRDCPWRREPAAAHRPDRRGPPPLGGALGGRAVARDGGGDVAHARPAGPHGAPERPAAPARADLPALRGADAAVLHAHRARCRWARSASACRSTARR